MASQLRPSNGDKKPITLPETLFGRRPEEYDRVLIKRILGVFGKYYKPRESNREMLEKLAALEYEQSQQQWDTVSQLLRRGIRITQNLIARGVQPDEELLTAEYDVLESVEDSESEADQECEICAGIIPSGKLNPGPLTPYCDHQACAGCLQAHVKVQLQMCRVSRMKVACPFCPWPLPMRVFVMFIGGKDLENYKTFLEAHPHRELRNFRWCPAPECHSGEIHYYRGSRRAKTICSKCGFEGCFNHYSAWHAGRTCAQFDANPYELTSDQLRDFQLNASLETIKKVSKRCPKCRAHIEKNGGCDEMWCFRCHVRFDWMSLKIYGISTERPA